MNQYKVSFTQQERSLLVKHNRKDMLEFDGCVVNKKTYTTIKSALSSLKKQEYGVTI